MVARGSSVPAVAPDARFVGRARELAELRAAWDDVAAGTGRLFLLSGEAGIGKTRLVETLAREASAKGARVVWGRAWEDGGAPALWPWIQILRELTFGTERDGGPPPGPLTALLAPAGRLSQTAGAIGRADQFPLFDAVADLLARIARDTPLVLAFDDLHAADAASLRLLDFVARSLPHHRWFVLGTYRPVEAQRTPPVAELLHRIARQGRSLPLTGLSEEESRHFVELAFGCAPTDVVARALHQTTEGNPFFLDEVVRLVLSMPGCERLERLPRGGVPLPVAVRDALRQRLHPLSAATVATLEIASVVGREFSAGLLRQVAAGDVLDVPAQLDEALAQQLVRRLDDVGEGYAFTHNLVRETLYDDLAAERRLELHRRIGAVLRRVHADDLDAHVEEIAHHALQTTAVDGIEEAVAWATRAARRAESVAAFQHAAQWYDRALSLVDTPMQPPLRAVTLLLAKGEALSQAWNTDSAQASLREAARRARAAIDRGDASATQPFVRAVLGLGETGIGMPRGQVDDELVDMLEMAVDLVAEAPDLAQRARVQGRLALELYFSADAERRHALVQSAERLARDSGDPRAMAFIAGVRLVTDWDAPDPRLRLRHADLAVAAALEVGDRDLEFRARVFRCMDLIELGDAAAWRAEIERYAAGVARHRRPAYEGSLATLRILDALWCGRFAEADEQCRALATAAERWEDSYVRISSHLQDLALRLERGGIEEIEPFVRAAASIPGVPPEGRAALAMVLRGVGKHDEARAVFAGLAAQGFADLERERHLQSILAWLTELTAAYGTPALQRALRQRLAGQRGTFLNFVARLCFGPSEYYRGLLDLALNDVDAAERSFETALERSRAAGGVPAAARAELGLARCLLQRGDDEALRRAARIIEQVDRVAADLAMTPLQQEVDALRRQLTMGEVDCAVDAAPATRLAAGDRGGRVVPFVRPASLGSRGARHDEKEPGPTPPSVFRLEEGLWTVAHGGTVLRLQRSKGLRYLAELLRYPGRELHALELAALDAPAGDAGGTRQGRRVSSPPSHRDGEGEPVLDQRARGAYQSRLAELRHQLQEAEEFHDLGRIEPLRREMEALTAELARAVGLGRRDRLQGSRAERARLNVTRAVHTAIQRIAEGHPALGRHLAAAVQTGAFCRYRPPAGDSIAWQL